MKRKSSTDDGVNQESNKKLKDASVEAELEALKILKPIQAKLLDLDNECVKEQLRVQRKFADLMRPLFLERQKIFSKIPKFWPRVISNLPMNKIFCKEDTDILQHLESVDMEDNLDERGSYKLTMKFAPDVKEFFEPIVLEKTVLFDDKGHEITGTFTKLQWKDDQNIVKIVQERRKRNRIAVLENQKREDSEDNDDSYLYNFTDQECSLFEWFSEEPDLDCLSLGDIIRRDIWQNPIAHLYTNDPVDDEDDEDFGDDDDGYLEDEEDDTSLLTDQ